MTGFFQRHPELEKDAASFEQQGLGPAAIARRLSERAGETVSDNAVRNFLSRRKLNFIDTEKQTTQANHYLPPQNTSSNLLTPDEQRDIQRRIKNEQERLRTRAQANEIRRAIQEVASYKNTEELIKSLGISARAPIVQPPVVPTRELGQQSVRLVAMISDTQVGLMVEDRETGPRFAYSTEKFADRLERLETEIIRLHADMTASGRHVSGIHLWFLGDLVENHNMRAKQRLTTDMTVDRQVEYASWQFSGLVTSVAQVFPKVYVDVIYGNHGRIGRYGEEKGSTNWDRLTGVFMREMLANIPHVTVRVHDLPDALIALGEKTFLLHHGDFTRSNNAEVPQQAITAHLKRLIALKHHRVDYVCMGHYHNPMSWFIAGETEILVNGAFFAGTDYSVSQLALSTPASQWLLVVDRADGIIERRNVLLETPAERAVEYAVSRDW